jgi:catechol 2,3-dioxygenase-like lactoylglutathione lyase family enzyme
MIPMFAVNDIYKTREFYKDILGFDLVSPNHVWVDGGNLLWCMVQAEDVRLQFITQPPAYGNEMVEANEQTAYYFYPENVKALHDQLSKKGYKVSELMDTPRGVAEFLLIDPDGRRLVFEGKP